MRYRMIFFVFALLMAPATQVWADTQKTEALDRLVATREIIDTVNRLFIMTDRLDWPQVQKVFAPEVKLDMTSMGAEKPETVTPSQITTAWDNGLKHLKAIHHQAGNYLVDFDFAGATVLCYGIASHYLPNASGNNVRIFVGSYDIHLKKSNESWLIDFFKFNLKYIDGNPELESEK